jgi:hypothetical protein
MTPEQLDLLEEARESLEAARLLAAHDVIDNRDKRLVVNTMSSMDSTSCPRPASSGTVDCGRSC